MRVFFWGSPLATNLQEDFYELIHFQSSAIFRIDQNINTKANYKLKTFVRYSVDRSFTRIIQREENQLEVRKIFERFSQIEDYLQAFLGCRIFKKFHTPSPARRLSTGLPRFDDRFLPSTRLM